MKYCKKCGAEISENASFCSNCGSPVGNISVSGKGSKKGIIFSSVGVLILVAIVVMVLFAKGVLGDKSTKVSINGKNDAVQKESLVECFDEFVNLTKDEIISKYEDKIINKDNIIEADISDWLKNDLSEYDMRDTEIYINYKLPGFEGDTLLSVEHMYLEWAWLNYLPEGKTIDDYKESYEALVCDFTEKYGEPYKEPYENGDNNEYTIIKQGYIVGSYDVIWGKIHDEKYKCDRYFIEIHFARAEDKKYVGDGNSDTGEDDSSDAFDDSEYEEDDSSDAEEW